MSDGLRNFAPLLFGVAAGCLFSAQVFQSWIDLGAGFGFALLGVVCLLARNEREVKR